MCNILAAAIKIERNARMRTNPFLLDALREIDVERINNSNAFLFH